MNQLSLPLAREARDMGLARTASANTEWLAHCLKCLEQWLARPDKASEEFPMEFFRSWWELHYLGFRLQPTNHHAWGALARAAREAGLIEWTGRYTQAWSKKTHAHPVKVWRRGPSTKGAT